MHGKPLPLQGTNEELHKSASTCMNIPTLQLWCARPDDLLDPQVEAACSRLLCEEEQARWKRFKFERNQREFLATHALARTALSRQIPIAPERWRFQFNDHGKPSIHPDCGLRFNLSNSTTLVVCLITANAEVGVDIEPRTRAESILEIAPRMFSPLELFQLRSLPIEQQPERALRLWTLKEAYIKARGMGLAIPLDKFSFAFDPLRNIRMEIDPALADSPDHWQFCQFELKQHCIAIMLEIVNESNLAPELQIWGSHLASLTSTQSKLIQPKWFPHNLNRPE